MRRPGAADGLCCRRRLSACAHAARHVGGPSRQSTAGRRGRPPLCRIRRRCQSIPNAWRRPRPRWRCGIRCCGCGFSPTAPSTSTRLRRRCDFPVTVHDLRDLAEDAAGDRLLDLREAKSHQQLDGQVFELTLSLLPGEKTRLHVDLDMQAADAMSYRTLMTDLATLYRGQQLPELGLQLPASTATRSCAGKRSRGRLTTPTGTGGRSASPSSRTRPRCRRRVERRCHATALGAGSGWIRRPGMRCSPTPAPVGVTPR